jgi:hypothetical protein
MGVTFSRESLVLNFDQTPNACDNLSGSSPPPREPERQPSSQAVGECGRDENLEKGAAHQLQMTTQARVCFRKILQRDFLTCRSSRSKRRTLQDLKTVKEHQKETF